MTLDTLTAIFGWMTLINIVIYGLQAGIMIFAQEWLIGVQSRIMGMEDADWPQVYLDYLSRYKLAILVFNLVPWLALVIAG